MPAEQRASTVTAGAGKAEDAVTAQPGYQRRGKIRSLQRTLYRSAKADRRRTFHQLYDHVCREDILHEAWRRVKNNGGAGGVDGIDIETFEENAAEEIATLSEELRNGRYRPGAARRVYIPKSQTEQRPLGIPTVRVNYT